MAVTYTGLGEWPTWLDTATHTPACRGHDTDLFFPSASRSGVGAKRQITRAKAICSTCLLLDPCREWALRQPLREVDGIWGGTTTGDRGRLLRESRRQ
ncbi:WhiB family transcriptional regulator [Micromonospora andamanensis]|uniref:WhiB family transcriptional regulator n=1 Tax=Micromonospora andamanensis TaxID=1287068 RepID=UPI00194DC4B5